MTLDVSPTITPGLTEEAPVRTVAIARGRAIKRVNALTAVLCGGLPALAFGIFFPSGPWRWLAGL